MRSRTTSARLSPSGRSESELSGLFFFAFVSYPSKKRDSPRYLEPARAVVCEEIETPTLRTSIPEWPRIRKRVDHCAGDVFPSPGPPTQPNHPSSAERCAVRRKRTAPLNEFLN